KFEALRKPPGFTGNAPGGPSRWSTERSAEWEPVDPKIVVEVTYDHFTGDRFRHGTRIVRWRKDKAPRQCTMDQVAHREGRAIAKSEMRPSCSIRILARAESFAPLATTVVGCAHSR